MSSPPPSTTGAGAGAGAGAVAAAGTSVTCITVKRPKRGCPTQFHLSRAQVKGVVESVDEEQPLVASMVASLGLVAVDGTNCSHTDMDFCVLCDPQLVLYDTVARDLTLTTKKGVQKSLCIACRKCCGAPDTTVRLVTKSGKQWLRNEFASKDYVATPGGDGRDGVFVYCESCLKFAKAHGACSVCLAPLAVLGGNTVCSAKYDNAMGRIDSGNRLSEEMWEHDLELVGMQPSPNTNSGKCGTWEENVRSTADDDDDSDDDDDDDDDDDESDDDDDESEDDDDSKKRQAVDTDVYKKTKRVRAE